MCFRESFSLKAYYLERLVRLTPTKVIVLLTIFRLGKIEHGPVFNSGQWDARGSEETCGIGWWIAMLYSHNFINAMNPVSSFLIAPYFIGFKSVVFCSLIICTQI